jgi:predicted nucleic acid-binding Zn ribbon protein
MREILNTYIERKRQARFEKRMILAVIFLVVVGFILSAGCL